MQKITTHRIRWTELVKEKKSGFAVGKFGDDGMDKNFEVFSTHRTEKGAVKKLRSICGIGHLQIVEIEK